MLGQVYAVRKFPRMKHREFIWPPAARAQEPAGGLFLPVGAATWMHGLSPAPELSGTVGKEWSRSRLERANESISLDPWWAATRAEVAMVAAHRPPLAAICLLFDGPDVCGRGALSACRGDCPERPCRRFVEAFRQRYSARSAPIEEWGSSRPFALESAVYLRSEAAIHDWYLQRHFKRWREPDCNNERQV